MLGATTEVAALQKALSEAKDKVAKERIEREKQEARVGEVQQELQALAKKHESLELDSKTQESELAKALESAWSAKAEAHKALQEIDAVKKIEVGKAFIMQSKHVKETFLLLTRCDAPRPTLQMRSMFCVSALLFILLLHSSSHHSHCIGTLLLSIFKTCIRS